MDTMHPAYRQRLDRIRAEQQQHRKGTDMTEQTTTTEQAAKLWRDSVIAVGATVYIKNEFPAANPWTGTDGLRYSNDDMDDVLAHGGQLLRVGNVPPNAMAPDARDRLARHMFVTALDPDLHDAGETVWDERRGNPRDVKRAYARADELLAVITGTKG